MVAESIKEELQGGNPNDGCFKGSQQAFSKGLDYIPMLSCLKGYYVRYAFQEELQREAEEAIRRIAEEARVTERLNLALDFVSKVHLFKALTPTDRAGVAKAFEDVKYSHGVQVIRQGDIGSRFFCIKAGHARVLVDGQLDGGLGPGDHFGEAALINHLPRNATVEADGALECLELSEEQFNRLGLRKKVCFAKRSAVPRVYDEELDKAHTLKTPEQREFIKEALRSNKFIGTFFTGITEEELEEVVNHAFRKDINPNQTEVITQGDLNADLFYIIEKGAGEVIRDGVKVDFVASKDSFGGLALLYQAPRTATVRVLFTSKLWCIPRAAMRVVLQTPVRQKIDRYAEILEQVTCLDHVSSEDKHKLADALSETTYFKGEYIIVEGEQGFNCFLLASGKVSVSHKGMVVATYKADAEGNIPIFGERALITDEPRAASVLVVSEKATLLVLPRRMYLQVVHPKDYKPARGLITYEYDQLSTLGIVAAGSFGKVSFVKDEQTRQHFELKAVSKGYILQEGLQACVINEKKVLHLTHSPFLVQMAASFNHGDYLMFLLEPALGGDLFSNYIEHKLHGVEELARFYAACVMRALEHLHDRHIIYRNMRPENLLLNLRGYCKLSDFGIAKFVIGKTFTTCGVSDYFAPEMLRGIGHCNALDWWTLGILIYELMMGSSPFEAEDPAHTCANVMQGIEGVRFPSVKGQWPDLIRQLCTNEPSERSPVRPGGVENVMHHVWYRSAGFSWNKLTSRHMEAPWEPHMKAPHETDQNIHVIPYVDPGDGWDADFEDVCGPSTFS